VRKHGRPAEKRHSLQIELKRTLYMDEATLVPTAGYARLERDLGDIARELCAFARDAARTGRTT
jgi:N-formylglutamate deformylase